MSDRKKLDREIARVQRDLNRWARKIGLIERGQLVVISARVDGVGLSARLAKEKFLKMDPGDFFSPERFREAGLSKLSSARLAGACRRACRVDVGTRDEPATLILDTMRKFLRWYPSVRFISGIKRVGLEGLTVILRILEEAGLNLVDDRSLI
jgi:hypothetical protein